MLSDMTHATATREGDTDMATRIDWRHVASTALGILAGVVATAGTAAVAVAGFTLSYDAIRKVGVAAGVRPDWSWLLPVSIDGAMAVATVTAVVMSRMGRKVGYPWFVVIVGATISIACNAVHATMRENIQLDDTTAMAVSAIPAVMLALSVHLLVVLATSAAKMLGDQGVSQSADVSPSDSDTAEPTMPPAPLGPAVGVSDTPEPATAVPATPPAQASAPRQQRSRVSDKPARDSNDIAKQAARRRVKNGDSCAVVATDLGVSKKTVERWTQDIREARQRATATPSADGDDAEERVG